MKTQLIEKLLETMLDEKTKSEPWNGSDVPFAVGKSYFIRTVTYHALGKVTRISGNFLVLEDACWVADSGKFSKAIKDGDLNEVEFVGDAIVSMNAIADAFPWTHKLPKETK
jgi:hypothetical protein